MKIEKVKQMAKDSTAVEIALTVFKAMAYTQTIAGIVKPKQQEVIEFFKFKDKDSGELINKEFDMYRASDEDFNLYLKEMYKFFGEQKLHVPEFGYCPLLIAEDLERQAKKCLIDYLEQYTEISFDMLFTNFPKNYNAYLDLNLKIFAPLVKAA